METPDKNGYTKDGKIAGDYIAAGRDPNLPRTTPQQIEAAIRGITFTKVYDCGCSASGGPQIPDYCPQHGTYAGLEEVLRER